MIAIPFVYYREALEVVTPISGPLGLHGDSVLTTYYPLTPNLSFPVLHVVQKFPENVCGSQQKGVDGSEAAIKREAASATQEEYNLLSIFWPLRQCLRVGTG